MDTLESFISGLHHTTKVICRGHVTVMDKTIEAVMVKNLYGQLIAWGMFSVEKGKFKGKLANTANTDGAVFRWSKSIPFEYVTWTAFKEGKSLNYPMTSLE